MPRTKLSKSGEITAFSEVAFRNNNALVEYCRTSACAISGCTAGIMGLTGLQGFAFYFCAVFGLWCLLLIKAGPSWEKYFVNRLHLLTNGFFGGLFTYVLFWTLGELVLVNWKFRRSSNNGSALPFPSLTSAENKER